MSYLADTAVSGKPSGSYDVLGQLVYIAPDPPNPEAYINVRLSNGAGYYTAGGTTVSGGAALSADQGSPGLLSQAWPVKLSNGSAMIGVAGTPLWVTGSVNIAGADGYPMGTVGRPLYTFETSPIITSLRDGVGTTYGFSDLFPLHTRPGSGSITAMQVGGVEVNNSNPVPVQTFEPLLQSVYDLTTSTVAIYVGQAPRGTAENAAAWNIKKTVLDVNGNPVSLKWATGVSWSDRIGHSYS